MEYEGRGPLFSGDLEDYDPYRTSLEFDKEWGGELLDEAGLIAKVREYVGVWGDKLARDEVLKVVGEVREECKRHKVKLVRVRDHFTMLTGEWVVCPYSRCDYGRQTKRMGVAKR